MYSWLILIANLAIALFLSRDGTSANVQDYGKLLMGVFLVLSAMTMLRTEPEPGQNSSTWEAI
jgi:hypothetical protein